MAKYYETQKTEPWKHYENIPNKSFEFYNPNTKAFKNLLIFENFQFFSLKFHTFSDMDEVETHKKCRNLTMQV